MLSLSSLRAQSNSESIKIFSLLEYLEKYIIMWRVTRYTYYSKQRTTIRTGMERPHCILTFKFK